MYTALVTEWGVAPKYTLLPSPPSSSSSSPAPDPDKVQIKVLAAGLHRVVRARATGSHYSAQTLPHVPGVDGVGTLASSNQLVYFSTLASGSGSFSETVTVPARAVVPLPQGVDPHQIAGFVNPALSSWMALRKRTDSSLPAAFSVLIMGATSASGELAIAVSKALGASRVVGCARDGDALTALADLDDYIVLETGGGEERPGGSTDFSKAADVDVILDYISGPATSHLLGSVEFSRPVQYVHIGSLSGDLDFSLPGSVLRSKNLTVRGSGSGSWEMRDLAREMPELLEKLGRMRLKEVTKVGLKEVEEVWARKEEKGERIVFVM